MQISHEFLDHWKTKLLIQLTDRIDAPLFMVRLWSHCERERKPRFDIPKEALAAICGYDGDASKFYGILLKCRIIDADSGSIIIHDWESHNKKLIASWTNGKGGGRPKKEKPNRNPRVTQRKPKKVKDDEPLELELGIEVVDKDAVNMLRIHRLLYPASKKAPDKLIKNKIACKKIGDLSENDFLALEMFYSAPKSDECDETWKRKNGSDTIINNIEEQIDLAHQFNEKPRPINKSNTRNANLNDSSDYKREEANSVGDVQRASYKELEKDMPW